MKRLSLLLALGAATLVGCGDDDTITPTPARIAQCPGDAAEVLTRIEALLPQLDLDTKTRLMAGSAGLPLSGTWGTPAFPEHGIPGFRMIDGPRGASAMAGQATAFPVAMARGATFNPTLEGRVGRQIALEVRGLGSTVLLAPTVNVLRHPRWGRAQETYGADPFHIGVLGAAFIEGAQAEGMITTIKHYAANSIEYERLSIDVTLEPRTLREIYLKPFERAVKQSNVASVMTAYNSVNGAFASENDELMDILYEDWGYAGFTMSDWIWGTHDTVKAVTAGLDLEMPSPQIYGPALAAAVRDGVVDEALVDRSVKRLLFAQYCYGLDEADTNRDPSLLETAEARELALLVAQRSIVLLKNDDAALPLSDDAGFSIAVMGRLADAENIGDTGSSNVSPTEGTIVTPYQGLVARAGSNEVTLLELSGEGSVADEVAARQEELEAADAVVLVVGYDHRDEGEGEGVPNYSGDRAFLELHEEDVELILAVAAIHDRVIVVVEGGSAVAMGNFIDEVEAVVMAWYPGIEGGTALADLFFGDVNFSGRLPTSFAASEDQLPPFPSDDAPAEVFAYGYFHDYRLFDEEGITPLFPFGFGLSYSEVRYDAIRLEQTSAGAGAQVRVWVDVENVGEVPVIETVQVYVRTPGQAVDRPVRDLRAFGQIELQPGETGSMPLDVDVDELGYWDEASHAFVLEAGVHTVEAGPNAGELPLSVGLTITP